jgi:hypothetical protein
MNDSINASNVDVDQIKRAFEDISLIKIAENMI